MLVAKGCYYRKSSGQIGGLKVSNAFLIDYCNEFTSRPGRRNPVRVLLEEDFAHMARTSLCVEVDSLCDLAQIDLRFDPLENLKERV